VAEHLKEVGEAVEEREGLVTFVQLSPLLVTLDCPVALAGRLSAGRCFEVRPADPQWPVRVATVRHVSRVADPASQTLKVELVVPNDDARWISGIKVRVDVSKPVLAQGKDGPQQAPDAVFGR
jgi:hypothetical protein